MGETVNKFVKCEFTGFSKIVFKPHINGECIVDSGVLEPTQGLQLKQLMFTASGRISLIIDAGDEASRRLHALERNLSNAFKGPGDVEHTRYDDFL